MKYRSGVSDKIAHADDRSVYPQFVYLKVSPRDS